MKIFGFELTRRKAANFVDGSRGWFPIVNEPYTGAWQRNDELPFDNILSQSTVYRCVTLIAGDVAKMRIRLVAQDEDGIWTEVESSAFSPVLRKPNNFQNRIQFFQQWLISKLTTGNTYVLKGRDARGVVNELFVLDPHRVKVRVTPNGDVLYELSRDDLSSQHQDSVTVPASEIIHDRMNALYHPLCGLSPIYASHLPATQSLRIQRFSDKFFKNEARPSVVLTAPGDIPQQTAERLKAHWETYFTGDNRGKVAILGSGLEPKQFVQTAVDAELVAQLKLTAEQICSDFGVPAYKVGAAPAPAYNNIEALNQQYFSEALQIHIESIELLLDEGLSLPIDKGTEFDLDGLLRMDFKTQIESLGQAVNGGIMAPNEARKKLNLAPVEGGDTPYLQQQNFSLEALNKRDSQDDPFGTKAPAPAASAPASVPEPQPTKSADVVHMENFKRMYKRAG